MARRTPRTVLVTATLGALVFAGAVAGAALTRTDPAPTPPPSAAGTTAPATTSDPRADGCLREPCRVLGTATLGDTRVELVADSGAKTGRLRIGGPGTSRVIEIGEIGVLLPEGALQCYPASISACLVRAEGTRGQTGKVVVGRSGKWSPLERAYLSTAGYIVLNNIVADSGPEVVTAQCSSESCGTVHAQVFTLVGSTVGCTRGYSSVEALPGYPAVEVAASRLRPCA
ncbi:hypothetical protein [Actinokineospora sp. UTMC 2448]|uniref:hypothetical protein n=1 Tax=Actinokineospora sp. UTMC 2448 TaxID=2268449 RepID=UPI0021643F0C|nr:hypothetical protein [Actinokineospora sp. UTMC 2448]UVS81877.1 hypothetical protein Actkin_05641 [Actinokineospora sp. UTMC 2448]